MLARTSIRAVAAIAMALAAVSAGACDGGGDADESPSPAATGAVTATAAAVTPTTAAPTPAPGLTPGPPAVITLWSDTERLVCDGMQVATVTAVVTDAGGAPVADGTAVHFAVATLGTADPINATTTGGEARTAVVAVGEQVGVVVNVTAGEAAAAIRVDCE